jgi:hypothetical protein
MQPTQTTPTSSDSIFAIIGLGTGPDDGITSENLDEYLYHNDWKVRLLLNSAETANPTANERSNHDNPHRLAGPLL